MPFYFSPHKCSFTICFEDYTYLIIFVLYLIKHKQFKQQLPTLPFLALSLNQQIFSPLSLKNLFSQVFKLLTFSAICPFLYFCLLSIHLCIFCETVSLNVMFHLLTSSCINFRVLVCYWWSVKKKKYLEYQVGMQNTQECLTLAIES